MKMLITTVSAAGHLILRNYQKLPYNSYRCFKYDVIVIGGGIIGTAIAKSLKESRKHTKIALVEKEHDLAQHQSSHNSQVIHAGIYYKPNSFKAKLCAEGSNRIYDYCKSTSIPVKRYGKLVIAKNILDKIRLKELYKRGLHNKVSGLELLDDWKKVEDIQPNCTGVQALWSPNSGNINWETVTKNFGNDFKHAGGDIFFNYEVNCVKESTEPSHPLIITDAKNSKTFLAKYVIMCLGLHSGTIFDSDKNKDYKNISLKVNYHLLNPKLHRFIRTNIYAMPHLDMPFIGIHMSPTVDDSVLLGPSAVPALTLDGYNKQTAVDLDYMQNHVFSKGFGLLFLKNFQSCLEQVTETFLGDVRTPTLSNYFPMLSKNDILPGPTAVQGQIVTNYGEFVDDFLIEMFEGAGIEKQIINCRFIPSPGATCSLALAEMIKDKVESKLNIC